MGLIARSAYFKICPHCGEHGRIILSDGRRTSSILSKEAGLGSVDGLLLQKQITSEEALALKQQIEDASGLSEEYSIVDELLGAPGGVVLLARNSEDDEPSTHADFLLGSKDVRQQKSQTMH